ncbi:MAG: serine/threonine-protein kinase [Microcoleaceae cyanobacterium]
MKNKVLNTRYSIQKQLSKNAGRRTFLAKDLQTQQLVVVKILLLGVDFQWEDLKLFEREAQILKMLSHPSIPRYLDYFDVEIAEGKGFALVQSSIPAKSLEQWLKSGRSFSETELKQLAESLLKILQYLHTQQPPVIHRDIKPSNILLENRSGNSIGQIYLVDFGSVHSLAAQKGGTITVVGTYGYMPPEQFGGRTVPASDLYSLGATLIYLVTGRHPAELSQDNLHIQFESAVNLNPALSDWLKWMTEPSLNRRLTSAEEAIKALKHPRKSTKITEFKSKVFGSKIKVIKNKETIEILIPPGRFRIKTITRVFDQNMGAMLWISLAIVFPLFVTAIQFGYIVHGIFLGLLGLLIIYFSGIPALFIRSVRVHLKPDKMYFTYEWLGYKRHCNPILKKNISQFVYQPGYFKTTKANKGKTKTRFISPRIVIFAGKQIKFSVNHLTDPEMEWIANELNAWLRTNSY